MTFLFAVNSHFLNLTCLNKVLILILWFFYFLDIYHFAHAYEIMIFNVCFSHLINQKKQLYHFNITLV